MSTSDQVYRRTDIWMSIEECLNRTISNGCPMLQNGVEHHRCGIRQQMPITHQRVYGRLEFMTAFTLLVAPHGISDPTYFYRTAVKLDEYIMGYAANTSGVGTISMWSKYRDVWEYILRYNMSMDDDPFHIVSKYITARENDMLLTLSTAFRTWKLNESSKTYSSGEEQQYRYESLQNVLTSSFTQQQRDQTQTSLVKCSKCGSKNVQWEAKQTRSADEGQTIFLQCRNCHVRWRMSS